MAIPFRVVRTGDRNLDDVQQEIDETIRKIKQDIVLEGDIDLSKVQTRKIPHKMGFAPLGANIIHQTESGAKISITKIDDKFITVSSDMPTKVRINIKGS